MRAHRRLATQAWVTVHRHDAWRRLWWWPGTGAYRVTKLHHCTVEHWRCAPVPAQCLLRCMASLFTRLLPQSLKSVQPWAQVLARCPACAHTRVCAEVPPLTVTSESGENANQGLSTSRANAKHARARVPNRDEVISQTGTQPGCATILSLRHVSVWAVHVQGQCMHARACMAACQNGYLVCMATLWRLTAVRRYQVSKAPCTTSPL